MYKSVKNIEISYQKDIKVINQALRQQQHEFNGFQKYLRELISQTSIDKSMKNLNSKSNRENLEEFRQ